MARRITSRAYATSRRNGYRVDVRSQVEINGVHGELVDVSVGGAAVRFPSATLPVSGLVDVSLPGAPSITMEIVTSRGCADGYDRAALRVPPMNWAAMRVMALWMFHTPQGVVPGLPDGIPVVAILPTS